MSKEINICVIVADIINTEFFCDEDEKVHHQTKNKQNGVIEGGLSRKTFITFSHALHSIADHMKCMLNEKN